MKRIIFISVLWSLLSINLTAQKYNFLNYSKRQGLSQSQVLDIKQDSKNYLWLATLDGLSRFNGKNFVNFYEKDGLLSKKIKSLFITDKDEIWIISSHGITILKDGVFSMFPQNHLFEAVELQEVFVDENKIWVSTEKNGIFLFFNNPNTKQVSLKKQYRIDFQEIEIKQINQIKSSLYVATNKGVFTIHNDKVEKLPLLEGKNITSVDDNSKGELWISTLTEGLYKYDYKNIKQVCQQNSNLINDYVTNVYVGKNDRVWVCTNSGLSELNNSMEIDNYTKNNGFNFKALKTFEDREGNIWVATNGSGIVRFANKEFLYLDNEEKLNSNLILSISEDGYGNTWFGSLGKGLSRLSKGKVTSFNVNNSSLPNDYVWTMLLDENKKFWVGTSGGLTYIENDKFVTYTTEDGLPSNKVQSLFQEVSEIIWIGTRGGVSYLKGEKFYSVDSFPYTNVRAINSTSDGMYWFGTNQGLVCYDGFITKLIQDSVLDGVKVYSIVSYGIKLWIGTEKGLIHYDGNTFNRFNFSGESYQSDINFLLKDKSNYLWIGTNKGVFKLNLIAYNKGVKEVISYTVNNGLIGMETNLNAVFQDDKENVWIGTSEGINLYRKDLKKVNQDFKPTIHLTNVKLLFEEKNWLSELQDNKNLSFGYKKNTFTFYYHSNFFKNPYKVKYSYMLEGLDEVWSPVESANFSRYPNLPHGSYKFRVKSTLDGKIWSDIAEINFVVETPFWLTWWFRISVLILLFFILYLFFDRKRKTNMKKREIELLNYKNKLIKLEQQSLNSSMNRHFIFNALNSIQFYINKEDKLSANRYLSNFSKLIRKNLDSSSNEDSLIPLSEEIERLTLYLSLENMRFKEKFTYEIDIAEEVEAETTKVPAMFMQPFVENSIWHGILPMEKPGKITIKIYQKDSKTYFEILDNGIGIDTSIQNKSNEHNDHSSQGMKIAANRIELLQKLTKKNITLIGPLQLIEAGKVKGTKVEIVFG